MAQYQTVILQEDANGKFVNVGVVRPAHADQAAVASGPATGSYTATEQAMLNELKTLVNRLRTDLVSQGLIKGSA